MSNLFDLLAAMLPVAITIMLLVLALLSQRLGAVTRRPPRYRLFYLAALLSSVSTLARIWTIGEQKAGVPLEQIPGEGILLFGIPLVLAVAIGLHVTWHYWGWLVYAREI